MTSQIREPFWCPSVSPMRGRKLYRARSVLVLGTIILATIRVAANPYEVFGDGVGSRAPDGHLCASVKKTEDSFLAVRHDPDASSQIVSKLKPHDFVDVDACKGSLCQGAWRHIEYTDWSKDTNGDQSLEGWVNSEFLINVDCGDEP